MFLFTYKVLTFFYDDAPRLAQKARDSAHFDRVEAAYEEVSRFFYAESSKRSPRLIDGAGI